MPNSRNDMISVIMPAFNSKKYIEEAVESVLSQTYQKFELIVVNDGSTDRTEQILKKYRNLIRYYYQDNQGAASARNKGILAAKGNFISFLDSDDIWHKDTLKIQYEYLRNHPDVGLVYGELEYFQSNPREGKRREKAIRRHRPEGYILENIFDECIFGVGTVMLRRIVIEDVGSFDENLPIGEDYDLWLRIASKYKIGYIPFVFMKYRHHPQSLTARDCAMEPWEIHVLEKCFKNSYGEGGNISYSRKRNRYARIYSDSAYTAFMRGQIVIARHRFIKGFIYRPYKIRNIFYLVVSHWFPRSWLKFRRRYKKRNLGKA